MTRTSQREDIFYLPHPPTAGIGPLQTIPHRARRARLVEGIAVGGGGGGGNMSNWTIHYYTLLIRERAEKPNIIQKLQSNFKSFSYKDSDHRRQTFKLPQSIVVASYVTAFHYKVINSILCTNTKLCKIGFRTNDLLDLCTFSDNQPLSLLIIISHLFCHCSQFNLNGFGLNLNYIDALFRINEFA